MYNNNPNNFSGANGSQAPPYQGQAQPYQGQPQPYQQGFEKGGAPPPFVGVAPVKSPSAQSIPSKEDQMFKSNEWRDLWAAVLYYLHLIALLVIAGIYAPYTIQAFRESNLFGYVPKVVIAFGFGSLTMACLLVTAFLALVHRAPESVIKGTLVTSVGLNVAAGVSCFLLPGGFFMGIVLLIFAAINGLLFFLWRNKIPFSSILLKTVIEVFRKYPSVWSLPAISVACFSVFGVLFMAIAIGVNNHANSVGHEKLDAAECAAILYAVFSLYWNFQVVENVVQTTIAGTMASFYFLSGTGAAIADPVFMSMRRAMTLSFGSICFGSLLVAIIQFIRFLLNSARGKDRNSLPAVLADCMLRIIEDVARFINFYAYVHVAIYGKPFLASAQDTWKMIKEHGIDVIINDNIVGSSMGVAIFLISCVNGLIAFVLLSFVFKIGSDYTISYIGALVSFLTGFFISALAIQLVSAAVSATLVCYAENPRALEVTKPELYQQITRNYRFGNNI
jgi:hypothetical protein